MKRFVIILAAALVAASAYAGDEPKTGFNFAPFPAIGYNSYLGMQYGMTCTIYDYGDGSLYPNYKQSLYVEASRYTKGRTTANLIYDSDHVIPGVKVTAVVLYNSDPLYNFYGFNGSATPYNSDLDMNDGVAYYNMKRNLIRAAANFQGRIVGSLKWAAGFNFLSYQISSIADKFGFDTENSIYNAYVKSGMIREDEADGGDRMEFNAGLVYDTRNAESVPSSGMWAEAYLTGSPALFGDTYKYLKLNLHFRHYIGLLPDDRLTLAYHLALQYNLAGEAPFYVQQNINSIRMKFSIDEGLGGKTTIRGLLYNRLIGESFAWANFECRVKLFSFRLIKQNFYLAANPFYDCGAILQPYRLDAAKGSQLYKDATKYHQSAGAGLKLVMNRNFVLSGEYARPFSKDDGNSMMILGMGYIF